MEKETSKSIEITLKKIKSSSEEEKELDILEFMLNEDVYEINLNDDKQDYLRGIFLKIISELFVNNLSFSLVIDKNYDNKLFEEIATEYINDLNDQVKSIYEEILKFNNENPSKINIVE